MPETDLPVVGKDTQLVGAINGAPWRVYDQITNFAPEPILEETQTNLLGKSGSKFGSTHRGWQVSFDLAINSKEADEFLDVLLTSYRAGVPVDWSMSETTRFRDGSSKGYTYPGLRLTSAPKRVASGDTTKLSITAKTGSARVAL